MTAASALWAPAVYRPAGLQIQNSAYDAAGQQTAMGGYTFAYDAEGRVKSSTLGGTTTTYTYDGDGRRMTKTTGSGTVMYVYDVAGQLAAEYGGTAHATTTQYLTADHLGSTRVVTSGSQTVVRRYDYFPFGEALRAGAGGNTDAGGYEPAEEPQKLSLRFTGKERDSETGLDYFGARYMSAAQGRFTSPDAPFADQSPGDPQSWNLYTYVRNNPLIFTDPTGNDCVYVNSGGNGIDNINNQNTSKDCGKTGGYWVDGTVTNARVAHGSLILTGTTNGENKTSASYDLGPDPGLLALQRGALMAEPGVTFAAGGTALVMGGTAAGVVYGAVAGGTALTQLAIYTLPVVPSAIDKPQTLGISVYEAGQIVGSPTAQRLIDTANGGNINVVQQVGEKLVRITLDASGQRIISAGIIQARNINNSIASGRFIVK